LRKPDPERLPSVCHAWRRLERARRLAYEKPWAHAVLRDLRVLQLSDYRKAAPRDTRWIADRLGIAPAEVERGLIALRRAHALKFHWTNVAMKRAAERSVSFGYSLFEVPRSALRKLMALHLDYVRAMQHIVSNSRGTECIGLYCAQLLDLASRDNALAQGGAAES